MSAGPALVGFTFIGAGALAVGLKGKRAGDDWRWVRIPLALVVLVLCLLSSISSPWPDGIGLQSCQTVVNPGLAKDATAKPKTVEVCAPLTPTAGPILLGAALVLLLLSPELTEISVPGLVSLRRQVEDQERTAEAQAAHIDALAAQVETVVTTSATASNALTLNLGGGVGLTDFQSDALKVLQDRTFAGLSYAAIETITERPIELALYAPVPRQNLLRQVGLSGPHVTDFRPGDGATGQAYEFQRTVFVAGPDVHNAEYGLTPDQQQHFQGTHIVCSVPLFSTMANRQIIGVLTCLSQDGPPEPDRLDEVHERWRLALEASVAGFSAYLELYRSLWA